MMHHRIVPIPCKPWTLNLAALMAEDEPVQLVDARPRTVPGED